jgi:hypothetical protein
MRTVSGARACKNGCNLVITDYLVWWRRGESEYSPVLKTRNLLIFPYAKNAEHDKIAPNWNVTGTRDFQPAGQFCEEDLTCLHGNVGSLDPSRPWLFDDPWGNARRLHARAPRHPFDHSEILQRRRLDLGGASAKRLCAASRHAGYSRSWGRSYNFTVRPVRAAS